MKKIPLTEWAARHYAPAPSAWVLRRWCRDGEINPPPERVGHEWYVREDASRGAAMPAAAASSPQPTRLIDRLRASDSQAA